MADDFVAQRVYGSVAKPPHRVLSIQTKADRSKMKQLLFITSVVVLMLHTGIAHSQEIVVGPSKIRQIIYEGTYSGESVRKGPRGVTEEDLSGTIKITLTLSNGGVNASYTTTGKIRSNQASGTFRGDQCRLQQQNGVSLEGTCTQSSFNGTLKASPSFKKDVSVSFQTAAIGTQEFVNGRPTTTASRPQPAQNQRAVVADASLLQADDLSGSSDDQFLRAGQYFKTFQPSRALALLEKLSATGFHKASNTLGTYYETGYYVELDIARALTYYELASKQGAYWGAWNLGRYYGSDSTVRDDTKALYWFQQCTKLGYKPCAESYSRIKNGLSITQLNAGKEQPKAFTGEPMGPIAHDSIAQYEGRNFEEVINGRNLLGHALIDPDALYSGLAEIGIKKNSLQHSIVMKETFNTNEGTTSAYKVSFCTKGKSWCKPPYDTAEVALTVWPAKTVLYVNLWVASQSGDANGLPWFCQLKDSVFWCNQHGYQFSSLARVNTPIRLSDHSQLAQSMRMGFAESTGANQWVNNLWNSFVRSSLSGKSSNSTAAEREAREAFDFHNWQQERNAEAAISIQRSENR